MTPAPAATHLEYYTRHGINPVRYDMGDRGAHFDRRGALYRTLGVTPLTVRGARVLEVAPGTGQNSLYLASLNPAELTLVEPNPAGQRDITALYATPGVAPVAPVLVRSTLQQFSPGRDYDLVVCENWLGHSAEERALLRKLGTLVADNGLLVVTVVVPAGFLANLLRKALTCRLDDPAAPFADRTAALSEAFAPHLRTIPAMTRSVTDWVHDCMLNPAYYGVMLTLPMVVEDLGARFDLLGSSPRFAADWRWFKALAGAGREFNRHFLGEYDRQQHNFFDYRKELPPRDPARNRALDAAVWEVAGAVSALEVSVHAGRPGGDLPARVEAGVGRVREAVSDLPAEWTAALDEFLAAFRSPTLTPARVAGMSAFAPLFGRETAYVSLEKTPARS